jgi:PAS domain S-box-containing protein
MIEKGNEARSSIDIVELAAISNSTDDAVISINLDGVILGWNHRAERIYGYQQDEAIGKNISLVLDQGTLADFLLSIEKVKHGEKITDLEIKQIRKGGKPIEVSSNMLPLKNSSGAIIGIIAIVRDISVIKDIERNLLLYIQIQGK